LSITDCRQRNKRRASSLDAERALKFAFLITQRLGQ
jgi:hypothetical protein